MGAGLILLAAVGVENMFLTQNPQITFFKMVYRRHTNFNKEQIPQYFLNTPNFGTTSNCSVFKDGDLMGNIFLVVQLPKINLPLNTRAKMAWVKRLGFALIKSVSVIINGYQIDKHYGDWLNLWAELTGEINGPHKKSYEHMIGNVTELTDFGYSKEEYTLYIPFQFWFCRSSGSVLPLVSLQHSDIRINVEFEEDINCYILEPSHYIVCQDDIVSFEIGEYIEQNINGDIRAGTFIDYDINTRRLYYYKITNNALTSIPIDSDFDVTNSTNVVALQGTETGQQYKIIGKTSQYSVFAQLNNFSTTSPTQKIKNLKFDSCFLLIDYYFLDTEERNRFALSRHDYLIEQLYYTPKIAINDTSSSVKIVTDNPCKLMAWTVQMKYIYDSKDYFNYTNTYQNKLFTYEPYDVPIGTPIGKNIILESTILGNGIERLSYRNDKYFEYVQQYQNNDYTPQIGLNMYSFSLNPFEPVQPHGTFNTTQVDNIEIKLRLSNIVNVNNVALFRGYCLNINFLRINNGLAGLVFTK